MEQQYVIGVANKFEALLDSEDPFEVLQSVEAEKQKKKALKAASSLENKENKNKDSSDVKGKTANRKPVSKSNDRVLGVDRNTKPENPVERVNNRRNRDERPPGSERNGDFPRTGTFREGGKQDGQPRGPRPDGPKGEKRDGPRPFRGDGESRPPRGPRQEGEARPFRNDRQQGVDGESRPPRKERREFIDPPDGEGRPDRRPGGPRGRGGRPPGPGRNYDTRGKREFDRKSGSDRTGVKAVDKRDGAGPFNWDSNKDLEVLASDLNATTASDEFADWDDTPKPESENSPVAEQKESDTQAEDSPPVVEEEPKELTLDEYRAIRGKRELPRYDIRKAGEGEDLTQWKDMVEMKKKNEEENEFDDDMEIPEYPQRVGRQRHVVGIDITFNDTFRGGRARGRGAGPAGGRGRGRIDRERDPVQRRAPREERKDGSKQTAPKVDDEKDFPSLG